MATKAMEAVRRESPSRVAEGTLSFPNVIRSEWTKLWSVRSTYWALLATVVVTVAISALMCAMMVSADGPSGQAMLEEVRRDPVGTALNGSAVGQLALVVLGVLTITSEYATRSIRGSLIAVPGRMKLLSAKAIVLAPVALAAGTVTSFAEFFAGQAILTSADIYVSLGDPQVLRAVIGGGLFLAANAMFGFGVGTLLRSTASGISAAVAALVVLPPLASHLPGTWGEWIQKLFTSNAGRQITLVTPVANQLGPWTGYLVFTLWWVVILAVAAILMRRRDA